MLTNLKMSINELCQFIYNIIYLYFENSKNDIIFMLLLV